MMLNPDIGAAEGNIWAVFARVCQVALDHTSRRGDGL